MAETFNIQKFIADQKSKASASTGGFNVESYLISKGLKKPDLSTPEGMEAAARAAGYNPPAPKESVSALQRVAGALNVGTAATSGFMKGVVSGDNPFKTSAKSVAGSATGKDIQGFSSVYRDQYGEPESRLGKIGLATGGFIADVLFDPLTYLTFGLGKGMQIGAKTLDKTGTKAFQEISTQAAQKFGNKAQRETELLFSEALGKKGITEESIQRLKAKGWDDSTISKVALEAPNMIDKGGIKFAGNTLIGTKAIAESPIGRALKVVSETEAVQKLKEALGNTFVPDFMKNPKLTSIIEKGGRAVTEAFQGILKSNEELFKGLSAEQMTRLFTAAWDKKVKIAHSSDLIEGMAKGMDQAAWLKKGVPNPYDEAGGLTAKARQALEGDAKKESKRLLQAEKITFEDDVKLQQVADKLFEPQVVEKKLADGSIVKEVEPSITAKYAKLAGIPEEDAIKFYIPSKFQEYLDKTRGGVAPSGVSSPKMGYRKEFTGVERADQIKDPFELFTRGQIEVVTDRIKTDMARAVVRELGIPLSEMSEETAKKLGYVKFERGALSTVKETVAKREALTKLVEAIGTQNKIKNLLIKYSGEFRKLSTEINNLNKQGLKAALKKKYLESPQQLKSAIKTTIKPSELIDTRPKKWDDFSNSYSAKDKLQKEFQNVDLLTLDLKLGGYSRLMDLGFDESTAKSVARQIFKEPILKPETVNLSDELISLNNKDPRKFIESLIVEDNGDLQKIQKMISNREPKLKGVIDEISFLKYGLEGTKFVKDSIRKSGDLNIGKVTGWIPKAVNDEIAKFYEPKMSPIDNLAKAVGFDYATSLFKGYVTSLFPSFHIRNITSNIFQNMLKIGVDALNPSLHMDATALVLGKNLDKQITTKTGKVLTLRQIRDMIKSESNILDAGAFGKTEQFIEEGQQRAIRGGEEAGRFNPLSSNNALMKGGRALGSGAEQEAKVVNIMSNIMQGKTIKEAVDIADETLFNYSKLTEFERSVLRRVIPFYTFARKNAELQIKTLATNPGAIATQLKGIRSIGEAVGEPVTEEDKKGLPSYVLNSLGIKAGANQYGQNTFITGFGLPIEEFLGRFSGDKGIVANTVSNLMTQMNPLLKYPAEKATGQDFFLDRPITEVTNGAGLKPFLDVMPKKVADEFKKVLEYREIPGQAVYVNGVKTGTKTKIVANPFALHFMRNLFTARIQSTIGFLSSEDETNWNKALKFFTGVKGWSIDQEQQKYYNDMARSRELQDFLVRMGLAKKFESLYTPKAKPSFEDLTNKTNGTDQNQ